MISRIFKQSIAAVLVFSMVAVCYVPTARTPRAHAQWAVIDAAAVAHLAVINASTASSAVTNADTAVNTTASTYIMQVLNGLAWAAAKAAIQAMTRSIVNWINSGFEGSPAFAQNLRQNLLEVGDEVAGKLLHDLLNNEAIQSPFIDKVVRSVAAGYYLYTNRDSLGERLAYTLKSVVPEYDQEFVDGNFEKGGWTGWLALSQEPQNNPYGAQWLIGQTLGQELQTEAEARLEELSWGRGFLSWRGECKLTRSQQNAGTGHSQGGSTSGSTQSLSQTDDCVSYEIKTPGSVIETTLGITATSPLRQLEIADSVNEIVAALASQLVTQIISETGLLGTTQPASGGGRTPLDLATDPSSYASAGIGQNIQTQIDSAKRNAERYKVAWGIIKTAAEEAYASATQGGGSCEQPATKAGVAQGVIQRATAAIAKADESIGRLNGLPAVATSSSTGTTTPNNTQQPQSGTASVDVVSNMYLNLLSSGMIILPQDATNAEEQARDTGAAIPSSLYTQMTQITADCQ